MKETVKSERHLQLYSRIDALLATKPNPVIAIDGRAASGKTTLAFEILAAYGCDVVHADDFFLPIEKRTRERLSEPGGNIDYERLRSEVIERLRECKPFEYSAFDCSVMALGDSVAIDPTKPVIVEGSYCLHPYFGEYADLKVFVTVGEEIQSERILRRNGAEMLRRFINEWIPMEEAYFVAFDIKKSCDVIYENNIALANNESIRSAK